jgi:hypothetical protein
MQDVDSNKSVNLLLQTVIVSTVHRCAFTKRPLVAADTSDLGKDVLCWKTRCPEGVHLSSGVHQLIVIANRHLQCNKQVMVTCCTAADEVHGRS